MPLAKEADQVYVLMTDKYRVSRNTRAQWYFKHLNQVVTVTPKTSIEEFEDEIEVVSMLPLDYQEFEKDESNQSPYLISPNTRIIFFARRYRLVYILDLSPSMATVDTQSNKVLYEEIFVSLSRSLRGLAQPFFVPGSKFLFQPEIFVTVLAHSPFFTSDGQQVVAKGWKITSENIDSFLEIVSERFRKITSCVSEFTTQANERKNADESDNGLNLNTLFEECNKCQVTMATPDVAMVNMFRYGLLALQLLPPQSNAGLIIITDGMLSLPNATVLENMLTQSRHHNIACSFLQVGSNPHPQSCFGYVPYIDLMKFITQATFGAYMSRCTEPPDDSSYNTYHRAFLAWSFQRGLYGFKADVNWDSQRTSNCWAVKNPYFYSSTDAKSRFPVDFSISKDQQPVRNKQIESSVAVSFTSVLSCRLREGYTIKSVNISETASQIQVTLVLPWKYNVNIEYQLTSQWIPAKHKLPWGEDEPVECHYEVTVEGSYGFLHDVTCQIKKPIKSPYRMAAIRQFWSTLKSLSQSDKLLVHLNNFSRNQGMTIPESIRSGNTLFYIAPNSSNLVLAAKTSAHQQFSAYWKPICLLDINLWQKWLHTHRINLILDHDMPFPKHLHVRNSTGRYSHVQCRLAMASLSELLKEYSSFVMLENHSYIKMIQSYTNEPAQSFFMIRVTTQLPCLVLHIAFIGGTPGDVRHKIVGELKDLIRNCKFPKRSLQKSLSKSEKALNDSSEVLQKSWYHEKCCIIMRKPIEKILIRYEKLPNNYNTTKTMPLLGKSVSMSTYNEQSSSSTMSILSKYMHHQRWIWKTKATLLSKLPFIAKILSVLTKVRLQEGFYFAYSSNGVINVVREIDMVEDNGYTFPCVIQYVVFPPHMVPAREGGSSLAENAGVTVVAGDSQTGDSGEWQFVSECWVEPQHGTSSSTTVPGSSSERSAYLLHLNFKEIANAFFDVDAEIISTLLAYEHLFSMCSEVLLSPSVDHAVTRKTSFVQCNGDAVDLEEGSCREKVFEVPFAFSPLKVFEKSQQIELLFSTLIEEISLTTISDGIATLNDYLFEMFYLSMKERLGLVELDLPKEFLLNFTQSVASRERSSQLPFPISNSDVGDGNSSGARPNWKCFGKLCDSLIVVVLPASMRDLISIMSSNLTLPSDKIPKNSVNVVTVINDKAESAENSEAAEEANGHVMLRPQNSTSLLCSLAMPVYIYRVTTSALTDQIIYQDSTKRGLDLLINNCKRSETYSEVTSGSRRSSINKRDSLFESSGNVSLDLFIKDFSESFWRSMCKTVMDRLQEPRTLPDLNVDKQDIAAAIGLSAYLDRPLLKTQTANSAKSDSAQVSPSDLANNHK